MAKKPVKAAPRRQVIEELIGDGEGALPTAEEAIGELNNQVKAWSRVTGLYQLLCDLREGIPANERVFPILEVKSGESKLAIDPSTWTESDQLELIELVLRNIINDYHKQLGGLADAAVTSVAAFAAGEGAGAESESV